MIPQADRLRIYNAVRSTTGDPGLAELVCTLAETLGAERALQYFKLAFADLAFQSLEGTDAGLVS
jgi:hypothetical protein